MKIVFDNIIFGAQKMGGISVSWYELLSRALRDGLDVHFVQFEDNGNLMRRKLGELPGIVRTVPLKFRKAFKYFPVLVRSKEKFIFHSSFYRFCPSRKAINIVIVHDFTNELFQSGTGAMKERFIKHNAIRHADYIVCNSNNTRNDFFRFFPDFPKERVSVIYTGSGDQFHPAVTGEWNFPVERKKYVLFVGERAGYKNFSLAVEAMKHFDMDLAVVGSPLNQAEKELVSDLTGRIHMLGRVPNDELNILYNNAYALLYPSAYEGFGLPVIEAQMTGCPVIAMKASSVAEIIGDSPLAFEGDDYRQIVSRLEMLRDDSFRDSVAEAGRKNAGRFSWETMYQQFLALYKKIYDGKQ